ncbi:MAG TPA: SGNH/GDSL hydrolase family protein [Methanosarcina sp.]|nr:SGNH/GDSL hydrolase family protein [Methanosarcina sp.]
MSVAVNTQISGTSPLGVKIGSQGQQQLDSSTTTVLQNSGISRTWTKIAASIAAAKNNNPQVLPPISAAPTWTTSTGYGMGQIVRGTGSDAGNLYLMIGSNTTVNVDGVSNSTGTGPSGIGTAPISDGTCTWLYVGKALATDTTTPFISTATLSGPTSDMNGYIQPITTTTATTIGLTSYRPVVVTGTFATEAFFSGGLFNNKITEAVNPPNGGSLASPNYAVAAARGSVAFATNARKWIALNMQAGYFFKNVPYEIIINGRYVSETPLVFNVDQSGTSYRVLLLNLTKFPEGRKTIEIRVNDNIQSRIAFEIYKEADDFVWPLENQNRIKFAIEGDSISVGSYVCAYKPRYWVERIIGDQLGADAVYNNAVGGTGMINNGTTKTTYLDRLPDLVAFNPDIVFVGGIQNDVGNSGSYTSANRQSTALTYFKALRAALPNALVVVVGVQALQGQSLSSGSGTLYETETDMKTAFTNWNDPNSLFVPLITDSKVRITSSNGKHYQQTGVAPYTDTHPIPPYYPFFGGMIAEKISKAVLAVNG